ncbi:MAG TPA: tetratricopeptide repeat protein [Gemmatimonadota bacterium]|nr:tetratricopeptide repeat protein [Gemmatimonadota bacterium]
MKLALAGIAVALVFVPVAALQAQEMGRFRVLIPNFESLEGANKKFGENAAKELRELINTLATHQPIEKKEIETNLKRFKMKMDELDCIRTRQLASQMDAQVALCASYAQQGAEFVVNAEFWDIASGESFKVDATDAAEKQEQLAAQHIFDQFDRYVQQVRFAQFCGEYAQSQQWDNALRNCDQALELNPGAVSTRYQRARILYEAERYPEALSELETVLELNPFHEDGLQLAGYISAKEGDDDQALDYYSQYLELNPGNAQVRMRIAYDLAQAGDPAGAMSLIQVGLDVDSENADLWEQYGGFAFAAALEINQRAAVGAENGGGVAPEAVEYFRKAIDAYQKVFAVKGADTPVGHLRNIVAAYVQLDEMEQAISMAEQALETHPQEDAIWSIYADALQRTDKLDQAIAALDRVKEINPSYPNVSLRQGNWLIQAGRVQDAVAVLRDAVAGNSAQADVAARLIFADSYSNGVQKERYAYAITGISAAKQLPNLSAAMTSQLNFWHAYALYTGGVKEQEPQTLATAQATLPKFQEAIRLFGMAKEYADSQPSITLSQFLTNTQTYVEIQEAIIKRGR